MAIDEQTPLQIASRAGGGQVTIGEVRGPTPPPGHVPLVTVYTVFGKTGPAPLACPGVKVGDRVCGGFAFDETQPSLPISVNRGMFASRGNFALIPDVVESTVTVADEIQQAAEDFTNWTFVIITQSLS